MAAFMMTITFPIGTVTPIYPTDAELMEKKLKAHDIPYEKIHSDTKLMDWAFQDLDQYYPKLAYDELTSIELELGYYKKWFFPGSATCPVGKTGKDIAVISCFWTKKHPENIISLAVSKKTIEAFFSSNDGVSP
jgi:hypothetical protein